MYRTEYGEKSAVDRCLDKITCCWKVLSPEDLLLPVGLEMAKEQK